MGLGEECICPYCGAHQNFYNIKLLDLDRDSNYGYNCENCSKKFVFSFTYILSFSILKIFEKEER